MRASDICASGFWHWGAPHHAPHSGPGRGRGFESNSPNPGGTCKRKQPGREGWRCCVPARVANAMPSYSKLTKYNTFCFTAHRYLQGCLVIVSGSKQSSAHRHCAKNATDRLKIGRQMEAQGKGAKGEACQLCERLKTYRK